MTDDERRALQGKIFRRKSCHACRAARTPKCGVAPDPCLGTLSGVIGACCGHGYPELAYVLEEGQPASVWGPDAVTRLIELGGHPQRSES